MEIINQLNHIIGTDLLQQKGVIDQSFVFFLQEIQNFNLQNFGE